MSDQIIALLNQTREGTFVVPAGHYIESIFQNVVSGDLTGGIKYGTAHGEKDVVGQNTLERLDLSVPVFSWDADTIIYFDAAYDWQGLSIDIRIVVKSLVG